MTTFATNKTDETATKKVEVCETVNTTVSQDIGGGESININVSCTKCEMDKTHATISATLCAQSIANKVVTKVLLD